MRLERNPCVYVLASQPYGTLYVGFPSDLVGRICQHREGITGGFATRHAVYTLVCCEMFGDMERALAREKQLKNWHRQ